MKKWLFLLLLFPLTCVAQTYQYLGVEDGLSNRRVYYIQKDNVGYMWFLTHEGIDRYNGKEFKRYKLMDGDKELNSLLNLNWLYIDPEGTLWEIGKKGKIFRYDRIHDTFELVYKLPIEDLRIYRLPLLSAGSIITIISGCATKKRSSFTTPGRKRLLMLKTASAKL